MGICSSSDSVDVSPAKLILSDGSLLEFKYPVKVSYVLQKVPASFICNSDEMDFDDVVSAMEDAEELQLGQLYFSLPLSRLNQPLHGEELAALAVKASSALMKSADWEKCGSRRAAGISDEEWRKNSRSAGEKAARGRRRKFAAKLSAIPE